MSRCESLLFFFLVMLYITVTSVNPSLVSASADSATIIIDENGTIDPNTAPIKHTGNNYTLTGDITNFKLDIQSSDITFNGANYTVYGIVELNGNYITLKYTQINSGGPGILVNGNHCLIENNDFIHNIADISTIGNYTTIRNNRVLWGAYCAFYIGSNYNIVTGNYLKGIEVSGSNNIITENTLDYMSQGGENNTYQNNTLNAYEAITSTATPQPTSSPTADQPTDSTSEPTNAPTTNQITDSLLAITATVVAAIIVISIIVILVKKRRKVLYIKRST